MKGSELKNNTSTARNTTSVGNGRDSVLVVEPRQTPLSKWPMPLRDWFVTIAEIPWASLGVIAALLGTGILYVYVRPFFPLVGDWGSLLTLGIATTLAMLVVMIAFGALFFAPAGFATWFERTKDATVTYKLRGCFLFVAQFWVISLFALISTWKGLLQPGWSAEFIASWVSVLFLLVAVGLVWHGNKHCENWEARAILFITYAGSGLYAAMGIPIYLILANSNPFFNGWQDVIVLGLAVVVAAINGILGRAEQPIVRCCVALMLVILFFWILSEVSGGKHTLPKSIAQTIGFRSAGPKLFSVSKKECDSLEARVIGSSAAPKTTPSKAAYVFRCDEKQLTGPTITAQIAWSVGARWILEFDSYPGNQPQPMYLSLPLTDIFGLLVKQNEVSDK